MTAINSKYVSAQSIEEERSRRGHRAIGRDEHYDLCNGSDCPCFREGLFFKRASHRDILVHFCAHDPEFVRECLAEAEGLKNGSSSPTTGGGG